MLLGWILLGVFTGAALAVVVILVLESRLP